MNPKCEMCFGFISASTRRFFNSWGFSSLQCRCHDHLRRGGRRQTLSKFQHFPGNIMKEVVFGVCRVIKYIVIKVMDKAVKIA